MDATVILTGSDVNTPSQQKDADNSGVPPPTRIRIGERIRRLREARNWPVNELGRRAGLAGATISRIETGTIQQPKHATVEPIAKALGVTPADLWGDTAATRAETPKEGIAAGPSQIDIELLTNCLLAVESELMKRGTAWSALKRARVVATLYEHADAIGNSEPDSSAFRRFMAVLFE